MKRLIRQNRGVTNVEIEKTGIKGFAKYAKRYHIDYEWMMRFLKWHIKDPNILWLVQKYLKAGVMVDEK